MNLLFLELEKINFDKKLRKNVSDEPYEYLIFHYTHRKFNKPSLSHCNKKYKKVYQLLLDIIKEEDDNFYFTSIIINKNVKCKKHKDINNVGYSYIFTLGDYEGGNLVIDKKEYDIRNRLLKFNGCENEHYTTDYTGTRYSIVYYTLISIKKYLDINNNKYLENNELKFHFRKFTTDYQVFKEVILNKCYNKYKNKFNKDDVWLDLGSNIGTFTCLAGKNCKKVYSYEPEKDNYRLLLDNIKLNNLDNIEPFNIAITEKGIEDKLYLCNREYNKYQHSLIKKSKKNFVNIKTKRFKDILSDDINCIKIDIEGSEIEILENNNFDNIKTLIFEYSFSYDNKTKRLINIIDKLKKNFIVKGNISQIYDIDTWDKYPRGKLVFCFRKI